MEIADRAAAARRDRRARRCRCARLPLAAGITRRSRAAYSPELRREVMKRTALGERLAPRVVQLLRDIDTTLLGNRSFVPARARRRFRIATSDYGGAVILPELVARIRKLAPGVEIELHAHRGAAPAEELARGELDVALGVFLRVHPDLVIDDLLTESFCCVVRRGHPSVGKRLSLEQFLDLDHLLISVPDYGPGVVDFALGTRRLQRRVVVHVPSFLVAPLMVARTDLIVTLPVRIAHLFAKSHGLRVLPAPIELAPFVVQMVWRGWTDDAALTWLRTQLLESAATIAAQR